MMSEIIVMRTDFLIQMDKYVRDIIGDEDIIDYWMTYGVPDGSSAEDISEIAQDNDAWVEIINCFAKCLRIEQ